ncbi:MAG: hypothetical protein ACPG6V_05220 [Flavobacteriales bacterium]
MHFLYYDMVCKVQIGQVVFDSVHSINITQDVKKLSDKAIVKIPRAYTKANINGAEENLKDKNVTDFISVKDSVKIWLGYNDELELEFSGFVSKIGADYPLIIECEDRMFLLKQSNFIKVFKSCKLSELVSFIAPTVKLNIEADFSLGKFEINNQSAFRILERLKKDYGIHSYFKDDVLNVGFAISLKPLDTHKLILNRNVRSIASNLKFVKKEDLQLLVRYISRQKNGETFTGEFGDNSGSIKEIRIPNIDQQELDSLAEADYKSSSFDGFQGVIPTFGLPKTSAGDAVEIIDTRHSERSGIYFIDGVKITFDSSGFKRKNHLGLKL